MKSKNSMETKINKEGGDTMAAGKKLRKEKIDQIFPKVKGIRVV